VAEEREPFFAKTCTQRLKVSKVLSRLEECSMNDNTILHYRIIEELARRGGRGHAECTPLLILSAAIRAVIRQDGGFQPAAS